MQKKSNNQAKKHLPTSYGRYTGIAFQMIAVLLFGVFGGIQLDAYFETSPILTVTLTIFAVFAAMVMVVREFIGKK